VGKCRHRVAASLQPDFGRRFNGCAAVYKPASVAPRVPMPSEPVFFDSALAFRRWLKAHAAKAEAIVVGFRKVGTGEPNMRWSEAVDEALCFGWIDGVRKSLGPAAYQIRFTPRRPGSVWSAINIAKVQALVEQGRMQPAGLAAFERRLERKSGIYAYEQAGLAALSEAEQAQFRRHLAAWAYFESAPPGYRKTMLHWVTSAKKAETRARRLGQLVQACAAGVRMR
jgi:uncharacterized protein YdeI (YjbR/CyaY-like superfamily)